ncbi:hypothetical protein X797_000611 [Metarhizium robertsii]|uniref:Uncharacterized protein n=1 Tax=Metarhizium robertsii TaxID=568076 RepID=A0A0A1V6R5_9HYPO|nr:hypothetical protein X797_000611 [Metarhizium robertsii]
MLSLCSPHFVPCIFGRSAHCVSVLHSVIPPIPGLNHSSMTPLAWSVTFCRPNALTSVPVYQYWRPPLPKCLRIERPGACGNPQPVANALFCCSLVRVSPPLGAVGLLNGSSPHYAEKEKKQ